MNKELIASRLQQRRLDLKITVKRLADLCKVKEVAIKAYESGDYEIPASKLYCLARALSVSSDWLVGLVDDPRPHHRIWDE